MTTCPKTRAHSFAWLEVYFVRCNMVSCLTVFVQFTDGNTESTPCLLTSNSVLVGINLVQVNRSLCAVYRVAGMLPAGTTSISTEYMLSCEASSKTTKEMTWLENCNLQPGANSCQCRYDITRPWKLHAGFVTLSINDYMKQHKLILELTWVVMIL